MRTGIAPAAWADEGDRAIVTALEMLDQLDRRHGAGDDEAGGRQLSG